VNLGLNVLRRYLTERAHFYFRRRIRGVREVHFYSLPDHAGYYAEMLGFLGAEEAAAGAAAVVGTVQVVTGSLIKRLVWFPTLDPIK
jgi:hypothetical protein